MIDGFCSKNFQKYFTEAKTIEDNGYPSYHRRFTGGTIEV
jgi:hypothetical protein